MKKLALFVEGKTEQIFALRLLQELAGRHKLAFQVRLGSGGASGCRRWEEVRVSSPEGAEFFVLIYNSATDSRVLSDLCEQYRSLKKAGYDRVLGLTDLFPGARATLASKQRMMDEHLRRTGVTARMILAVMEIEAWFLAEDRHYLQLDAGLTAEVVAAVLGGPPETLCIEDIAHPSDALDRVYAQAGLRYLKAQKKNEAKIQRTVAALDIENLVIHVATRVPALGELCQELDQFLTRS